jgi:hypothetical protein
MAQTPTKYELAINIKKALGLEMLAQRESGSSATCLGGAPLQQPSGREISVLEETLTELDQSGSLLIVRSRGDVLRL